MRAPRSNDGSSSPKGRRHRRSEDELIAALQAKISMLERRKQVRAVKQDPALKLADKLIRSLKKAESQFATSGRQDLANSAKAAAITFHQVLNAAVGR